MFYLTKKDVSAHSCLLAKDKLWNNLQKGKDFRKFCLYLGLRRCKNKSMTSYHRSADVEYLGKLLRFDSAAETPLGSSSRNGYGHHISAGQCQVAAAQILWFKCSRVDKGEHVWILGSSCFFCRALTNMDDNFLPMLNSEELKQKSKWSSSFELLDLFFFQHMNGTRYWRDQNAPHPAILLDNGLEKQLMGTTGKKD